MDTEAPTLEHEFFVTLKGGTRGKITITAKPDGEIVGVVNGALLGVISTPGNTAILQQQGQLGGIRKVLNADGSITPIPSEKMKRDIKLFVPSVPCWFPECEALRLRYHAEIENLPPDCPSCERGAVMRKYLKRMESINTDP